MTGEVRLWRWVDSSGCIRADWALSPSTKADIEGVWLPAAEFEAWRRVMLAARCWRDTVIFPNEENGSEVDLCAAVDALPSARKEGPK